MAYHDENAGSDNHGPYVALFADTAARLADATTYQAHQALAGGANPAKALQLDTVTEYYLANHAPVTWVPVNVGGGGGAIETVDVNRFKIVGTQLQLSDQGEADYGVAQAVRTAGPTDLPVGVIADGDVLIRNGGSIEGTKAIGYSRGRASVQALATSGALVVDCSLGNEFRCPLTGDASSITVSGKPAAGIAQTARMVFVQDATPRSIPAVWTGVDWWVPAAGGPVMPTDPGKNLLVTIYMNGNEAIGTWAAEP